MGSVGSDKVEQGEEEDPDDVDEVPVKAGHLNRGVVIRTVFAPQAVDGQDGNADDHVDGVQSGHREVQGEIEREPRGPRLMGLVVDLQALVVDPGNQAVIPLLLVLHHLDAKEDASEEDGENKPEGNAAPIAFGRGMNGHGHGQGRADENDGVDAAQVDVEQAARLGEGVGVLGAEDRVGHERIKGAYAWRTFLAQGSTIACGSDFPVEKANPFLGLHAAVTRESEKGMPVGGWYPNESLSLKEAFRCFTLDAAYAANQENVLGSLEPGKWADFIVIDQDLFRMNEHEIYKVKVLQTWVAGKRVFGR